jgi:hypothetical protein
MYALLQKLFQSKLVKYAEDEYIYNGLKSMV